MTGSAQKCLAIAASYGKIGFVCMRGTELLDWGKSLKASQSIDNAFTQATKWLRYYRPDVLITEQFTDKSLKGDNTRALVEALQAAADERDIMCLEIFPVRRFKSKYDAAAAIARRYPQLAPWVPKHRRIFDKEPRNIIYFEALALWLEYADLRLDDDADGQPSLFGNN